MRAGGASRTCDAGPPQFFPANRFGSARRHCCPRFRASIRPKSSLPKRFARFLAIDRAPARVRADARSAGANHRQGLAALLDDRHPRADVDAEGEVRRLSANFQHFTRSKSVGGAIDSRADLEHLSLGLLEPLLPPRKRVRVIVRERNILSYLDDAAVRGSLHFASEPGPVSRSCCCQSLSKRTFSTLRVP